ncbi:cation:H+ antiporter [Candidatus Magnetomoraceae bacterium gMMP-1]
MTAITSFLIMSIAIYILSIVTDKFFVESLDQIVKKWHIPHNVAGASLMAVGSSAPELSIALFALFRQGGAHSDIGIGTIVGSAVFNILVITGVSAIIKEARVTLPAVVRDTFFYVASIILLLFVFWNGEITLIESLLFIGLYALYILFLFRVRMDDSELLEIKIKTSEPKTEQIQKSAKLYIKINNIIKEVIGCLAGDASKSYVRAFIISIIFIASLSWILVDYAIIFANAIGLPPVIIALTILAAGTSAPDLISSIIVARQGRGSMAISNAIGSNIFDILIGLGLPWFIAIAFFNRPTVHVTTNDLLSSIIILIGTVITLFIFLYTDRILSKKEGFCLVFIYIMYAAWTSIVG